MGEDENLNTDIKVENDVVEKEADNVNAESEEVVETKEQGGTEKEKEDKPPTRSELNRFYAEKRKFKKQINQTEDSNVPEEGNDMVKAIRHELSPIINQYNQQNDKAELDKFFNANPHLDKYKERTWKYWQDDSRHHLPIKTVAYEVAGDDLIKAGAEQSQKADQEANEFKPTGQASTGKSFKKDPLTMTHEEFDQEAKKIMMQ